MFSKVLLYFNLLPLFIPGIEKPKESPICIMTWNIRLDTRADSMNAWPFRKEKVFSLIGKYAPDILGTQEALNNQVEDLRKALPGYGFVGAGREDGKKKGEYAGIFYRKSRFRELDHGTFWLSPTPQIPGSKGWDAAITRVASWLVVEDKQNKNRFFLLNTHFDHMGVEARLHSAELILEQVRLLAKGLSVIVTGDLNCTADSDPLRVLTSGTPLLHDALSYPDNRRPCTFTGFRVTGAVCQSIDYILPGKEWLVVSCFVPDESSGGFFPSDHHPVVATLLPEGN
jgi:endonuclease/exonuclease/phosphatase family metal-dependent hydrolase